MSISGPAKKRSVLSEGFWFFEGSPPLRHGDLVFLPLLQQFLQVIVAIISGGGGGCGLIGRGVDSGSREGDGCRG